jgi:CSLREA domain-containing protein
MSRKSSRRTARRSHRTSNHSRRQHSNYRRSYSGRSLYTRSLRLEQLEDRRLLSGSPILVTTLADTVDFNDGVTSLREAIFAANIVPGADTIQFAPVLTAAGPAKILLTCGELKITDSLTITGPGADLLTIDASGNDPTPGVADGMGSRIFNVDDGNASNDLAVQISGLALMGGDSFATGGAVTSRENLIIANCAIAGNASRTGTGGIYSLYGELTIEACTITGNSCPGSIVAEVLGDLTIAYSTISENADVGAAISEYNGKLLLLNSNISDNAAQLGRIVYVTSGQATLSHVTLTNNSRSGFFYDAGVVVAQSSKLSLSDCIITANENLGGVSTTGGQTQILNSTINVNGGTGISTVRALTQIENCAINDNHAGGIYVGAMSGETATISNCVISGNNASAPATHSGIRVIGGGILVISSGSTSITDCAIVGNTGTFFRGWQGAADGGGIYLFEIGTASASIARCTISGNTIVGDNGTFDGVGGGIAVFARAATIGPTLITNCLIYDNSSGKGGGIYVSGGDVTVSGSSICRNYATSDGGSVYEAKTASGKLQLGNSTISGNTAYGQGGGLYINGAVEIGNTTLAQNYAQTGGGAFIATGGLAAKNTLLTGNHAGLGPDVSGYLGATIDIRYCLVGNSSASGLVEAPLGLPDANGNLIGGPVHGVIDPLLGPLADNGGFTLPDGSHILTHALLLGSPAINAGDPSAIAGVGGVPSSDERGAPFTRVYGGRIDIGAVEFEPPGFLAGDYNHNGIVDAADYTGWRDRLGANVTPGSGADGNGDGVVDQLDYGVWRTYFGATQLMIGGASEAATPVVESLRNSVAPIPVSTEFRTAVSDWQPHVMSDAQPDLAPNPSALPWRKPLEKPARQDLLFDAWPTTRGRGLQREGAATSGSSDGHPRAQNRATDDVCQDATSVLDRAFALFGRRV